MEMSRILPGLFSEAMHVGATQCLVQCELFKSKGRSAGKLPPSFVLEMVGITEKRAEFDSLPSGWLGTTWDPATSAVSTR